MENTFLPKITVLSGPTASGKSSMGLELARMFDFEIISADSRQVYKQLTIGTAKPLGKWSKHPQTGEPVYLVEGVPHYLLDCVGIDQLYTVALWKKSAEAHIYEILKRGKRVFIVGGTGLYINALIKNFQLPIGFVSDESNTVKEKDLRVELKNKSLEELVSLLRVKDPLSASQIDIHNPRRVRRALEVTLKTGKPFVEQQKQSAPLFEVLHLGVKVEMEELRERINTRVDEMIQNGFVEEVRGLLENFSGDENGINNCQALQSVGYKEFRYYLNGKMTLKEAIERIKIATRQYARRQITWFKRDTSIISVQSIKNAGEFIKKFYT